LINLSKKEKTLKNVSDEIDWEIEMMKRMEEFLP
jgi:hypothetical protein